MTSALLTTVVMWLHLTLQTTVWLLNIMNIACAFPSIWVLLPVRPKQHQLLPALYCTLSLTAIYTLAKHLAVVCFASSSTAAWIWVVAFSQIHPVCATLCLMTRQEMRRTRTQHAGKSRNEPHQQRVDSWWKSDKGSTVICLLPAATLDAITSAAMLLFEKEFDRPAPQAWTPLLQVGMYCFTVILFMGCRYADYMILCEDKRFSYPVNRYDIIVGSIGVLSLLIARLLCDTLMPVSALIPPI